MQNKGLNVKREQFAPHCETFFQNSKCPYIKRGCTGCMMEPWKSLLPKIYDKLSDPEYVREIMERLK